jgi:hypothetical protein
MSLKDPKVIEAMRLLIQAGMAPVILAFKLRDGSVDIVAHADLSPTEQEGVLRYLADSIRDQSMRATLLADRQTAQARGYVPLGDQATVYVPGTAYRGGDASGAAMPTRPQAQADGDGAAPEVFDGEAWGKGKGKRGRD